MNIDELPDQLEAVLARARAALSREIARSRKAVDSLNAEKAAAAKAVGELKDQHSRAEVELKTTLANLDRVSNLGAIQAEIKKAGTELERLQGEVIKETKILEIVVKKRTQEEARVAALETAAREAVTQRARAQDLLAEVKSKVGMVI